MCHCFTNDGNVNYTTTQTIEDKHRIKKLSLTGQITNK